MRKPDPAATLSNLAAAVAGRLRPGRATPAPADGPDALMRWVLARAQAGIGPLDSAEALARRYRDPSRWPTPADQMAALARMEAGKTFTTGFITGFAGMLTLPVAMPAALVAAWLIQARMVLAMASLMGHDPESLWVRTTVLLALDEARAPGVLAKEGITQGDWASLGVGQHMAGPIAQAIYKRAGEALLRRVGQRGWTRIGRAVPVLGALVAGGMDAYGCRQVAARAQQLLLPQHRQIAP